MVGRRFTCHEGEAMGEFNGRRTWSASEKLRIVMAGLQAGDIAELCRREGISPT